MTEYAGSFEFEKKGYDVRVELVGEQATLKMAGVTAECEPHHIPESRTKRVWGYVVKGEPAKQIQEKVLGQVSHDTLTVVHPSAQEAQKMLDAAKEARLNAEPLTFRVVESSLGDYNIARPLLDVEKEELSQEDREQIRALNSILGTGIKFAGGPRYIEADKLDVEVGETYTAEEIWEMAKKTEGYERWQQKKQAAKDRVGAIAFHRCWECGVARIVGKVANEAGRVKRMPKSEWRKVQADFEECWKKQFEDVGEDTILSSAGTGWAECMKQKGYKVAVVDTSYCGC